MSSKACRKCDLIKPLDAYYQRKNAVDGRYNVCILCARDDTKEWKKNLSKDKKTNYARASVVAQYSLTLADYDAMVERQNGVCAVCRQPPVRDQFLAVDHNRSCCPGKTSCGGCVRGLLCIKCNTAIGMIHDSPKNAMSMAFYLEDYKLLTKEKI